MCIRDSIQNIRQAEFMNALGLHGAEGIVNPLRFGAGFDGKKFRAFDA